MEKVRRKYDALLQSSEAGFHEEKNMLETIYNKVLVNQILAEEFRAKFIDTKGGTSASPQGMKFNIILLEFVIVSLLCKVNIFKYRIYYIFP